MSENQTLEVQIKATAEEAKSGIDKLITELTKLGESVEKVSTKIVSNGSIVNKILNTIENNGNKIYDVLNKINENSSLKNTRNIMNELSSSTSKTNDLFSKLGTAISLTGLYYGVKRLSTTFLTWMDEATDRTEQLNLFNVVFNNIEKNGTKTFSSLGQSATKFQYKLNEAFGTNLTDTLKYQALFQSMGVNASIPEEYASIMSETMTKFTYDLASLYNKSESTVAEALRAGVYAGQTKPLRSYGIDVTQSTMTPLLQSLGITDRTVSDLSQGEKEILRYIGALNQAKVAMGDYANTVESPANQMKVFKDQLTEAKVAFTSLFIGTFSKALPYANAMLLTIKGICSAIATMFGIKLEDYNTSVASGSDAYSELSDDVDNATESVKELKRQTLGFDQINNLQTNKDSSSDTTTSGGIDQRLLDAINGYDNGMSKVKMKATEIYEKIMGWLGFLKEIDPLTGEITWKLDGSNSTMGKILVALKNIIIQGKKAIIGVFKVIKKDFDNGSFGKLIASALEKVADLLKTIGKNKTAQDVIAKLLETFVAYKVVVTVLDKVKTVLTNLFGIFDKLSYSISGLSSSFAGLTIATTGFIALHNAISSITDDGANLANVTQGLLGTVATVGGSIATFTALLGPVGTILGTIVGLTASIASVTSALFDEEKIIDRITNVNQVLGDYKDTMLELDETKTSYIEKNLNELAYYEDLYKELKLITDENGNILDGYETRANFIVNELAESLGIEISIVDGQVQKYSELEDKIYDVVSAKRAEYLINANADKYNEAKNQSVTLEKAYAEAVKNTTNALSEADPYFKQLQEEFKLTDEELQDFINTGTLSLEHISLYTDKMVDVKDKAVQYRETLVKAKESEEEAGKVWANNQKIIGDYETALGLLEEKNYTAVTKIYTDTITYQGKTQEETTKNYDYSIQSQKKYLKDLQDNKYNYDEDYLKEEKNRTRLKIQQLEKEKQEVLEEMDRQNELVKLKTLDGVNEQLKTIKDKSYEFKETSSGNMQLYVDGIASGNEISTTTMSNLVNATIQKIKDKKMSAKEAGEYLVDGVNLGIGNSSKQNNVYSTIGKFTTNIIDLFKSKLNIHSPSKTTQTFGRQLIEGLNIGINDEKDNVLNNLSNFTSSIVDNMNTDLSRFIIDFNKTLTLNELNGNISNQTSVDIGDYMSDKISRQIAMAINNQNIDVILEAHTDEGVIIDRINQSTKQTGVCPINIPY